MLCGKRCGCVEDVCVVREIESPCRKLVKYLSDVMGECLGLNIVFVCGFVCVCVCVCVVGVSIIWGCHLSRILVVCDDSTP